jgi:hypothetical protein
VSQDEIEKMVAAINEENEKSKEKKKKKSSP